jgi:hypothetical protein
MLNDIAVDRAVEIVDNQYPVKRVQEVSQVITAVIDA